MHVFHKRKVVVTGLGVVAPNGTGVDNFWSSIAEGRSAAALDSSEEFALLEGRVTCRVKDFDPLAFMDPKTARRMNRASQMAVAAARMAAHDAALDISRTDPYRIGISEGTTLDGADWIFHQYEILKERGPSRLNPFAIHATFIGAASGEMAIDLGVKGPCQTVCTGCAAGADAIGLAMKSIRDGEVDIMIAGGADAPILYPVMAIFNRVGILSRQISRPTEACRPFDTGRDGTIMGEGAAFLVLESDEHAHRRDAPIKAYLDGYGRTCDAFHITSPDPEGESAAQAMRFALRDACLEPMRIDYLNAHGTATDLNDRIEAKAIHAALGPWGEEVLVSSTKPVTGHLMGAAGAAEALAIVLALVNQTVPPNINLTHPDPELRLNIVSPMAREAEMSVAATNSFGFGGKNATLIFSRHRQ